MAPTETLSVRLTAETRATLTEAAHSHDSAGASALAREILEHWARRVRDRQIKSDMKRAVSFMLAHDDWGDDPADFFPAIKEME